MVGRKYEAGGIARDGAKMVTAVRPRKCRSSPRSSAAPTARATTACAARLRAALPVDVAERAHLRAGRRTGRKRACTVAGTASSEGRCVSKEEREIQTADPRPVRAPGAPLLRQRTALGRRRGRSGRHAPAPRPRHLGLAQRAGRGDEVRRIQDVTEESAMCRGTRPPSNGGSASSATRPIPRSHSIDSPRSASPATPQPTTFRKPLRRRRRGPRAAVRRIALVLPHALVPASREPQEVRRRALRGPGLRRARQETPKAGRR